MTFKSPFLLDLRLNDLLRLTVRLNIPLRVPDCGLLGSRGSSLRFLEGEYCAVTLKVGKGSRLDLAVIILLRCIAEDT